MPWCAKPLETERRVDSGCYQCEDDGKKQYDESVDPFHRFTLTGLNCGQ